MIECSISHQFDYSHGVQSNCLARVGKRTDGIWGFNVRLWNSKYFLHYRLDYVRRFWHLGWRLGKFRLTFSNKKVKIIGMFLHAYPTAVT